MITKVRGHRQNVSLSGASAMRQLAAAILLQAWRDTGVCSPTRENCQRDCRAAGRHHEAYCDLPAFWHSSWAEDLCSVVDLDYHAVLRLVDGSPCAGAQPVL